MCAYAHTCKYTRYKPNSVYMHRCMHKQNQSNMIPAGAAPSSAGYEGRRAGVREVLGGRKRLGRAPAPMVHTKTKLKPSF